MYEATIEFIRRRFSDPCGSITFSDCLDGLLVEYDRNGRWNSLMVQTLSGEFFVYENTDTFDGPEGQVIIYEGANLTKAVRSLLEYRPLAYGWQVGTDIYANRKRGSKKIALIR